MWNRRTFLLSLYIGVISGVILGLILKVVEKQTNLLVYTLLLNVDFIPIIGSVKWTETIEFLFHIVISIMISITFVFLVDKLQISHSFKKLLGLSLLISLPTFPLFFILSMLAIKDVPTITDWYAFTYWTISHLIYVILLPVLYSKTMRVDWI